MSLIKRPFFAQEGKSLILIGMPGSGKTTLGKALAQKLSWVQVDTDFLLQAWWGIDLENLRNILGLKKFLKAEEDIVLNLKLNRCVISTGGSVIYSDKAMAYLQRLGVIIYLKAPLKALQTRIAKAPLRGLALKPGQSLADLYQERTPLYTKYAHFSLNTTKPLTWCVDTILTWLKKHKEFQREKFF